MMREGLALAVGLLAIAAITSLFTQWAAISNAVSLAAVLAFNYSSFRLFALTIADPQNWIALIAFLTVSPKEQTT